MLLQLVAKALLTEYKQVWGDLDRVGMVQATARVVGQAVMERTAANVLIDRLVATARRQSENLALVDRAWHAWAFEERERHSLESLARRMRRASGRDFEAVNRLSEHMLFVARAHLERVTLEAFIAGIDACTDPGRRPPSSGCAACTRCPASTTTAPGSWSTTASRRDGRRPSARSSTRCARNCVRRRCRWSRASACRRRGWVPPSWQG